MLCTSWHCWTMLNLINVLPQFVTHHHNTAELEKVWFHAKFDTKNVTFEKECDDNWTGEWATEDDALQRMVLKEDAGIDFNLDEVNVFKVQRPRQVVDVNNLKVHTFKMSKQALSAAFQQGESDADSTAAALSSVSGESGHTQQSSNSSCVAATGNGEKRR